MLKTVQICDKCGTEECPWESIYAVTMPTTAPATEAVDLCPMCMMMVMREMVSEMTPEYAKVWVERAKRPLKTVRA